MKPEDAPLFRELVEPRRGMVDYDEGISEVSHVVEELFWRNNDTKLSKIFLVYPYSTNEIKLTALAIKARYMQKPA